MTPQNRFALDCARARFACDIAAFCLSIDHDLLAPDRGSTRVAQARQIAMYLTHIAFGMSLHRVASAFGRDRSTVAHACHVVEDRRDDHQLDQILDQLELALKAAPGPLQIAV